MRWRRWLNLSPLALIVLACGGATEGDLGDGFGGDSSAGGQGGSSGSKTAGGAPPATAGTGGWHTDGGWKAYGGLTGWGGAIVDGGGPPTSRGGRTSAGGGSGAATGVGGGGCCLADPVCNAGELEIPNGQLCPGYATCYERTVCCTTIQCAKLISECDVMPICNPGDTQFTGSCPRDVNCYEVTACGVTIGCAKKVSGSGGTTGIGGQGGAGGAPETVCNPSAEYYRRYVGHSVKDCQVLDYLCSSTTTPFQNECGCGCEQPLTCPQFVDCMPPATDPLCTAEGQQRCPYTQRAF